jgi:hypothetical protein
VFGNRVLRGIFGPKMDEIIEDWRKLYTEDLNNLYSSLYTIRNMTPILRWAGHVVRIGMRTHKVLAGKP